MLLGQLHQDPLELCQGKSVSSIFSAVYKRGQHLVIAAAGGMELFALTHPLGGIFSTFIWISSAAGSIRSSPPPHPPGSFQPWIGLSASAGVIMPTFEHPGVGNAAPDIHRRQALIKADGGMEFLHPPVRLLQIGHPKVSCQSHSLPSDAYPPSYAGKGITCLTGFAAPPCSKPAAAKTTDKWLSLLVVNIVPPEGG